MARTPKDVTDAELRVLQTLWELGPSTIRQLTDRLHPSGGIAQYATVQVLLDRLRQKQYVVRQCLSTPYTFTALVDRDELIGRKLRSVAETLCGGSVTPLLTHLVRARKLSARERDELRALIDELDEGGKGKRGR
ncbi:MAG: BlaI/MecI/CopY family transcriptional regulator [Planctomycetes bacterium]|nr:BlaI/MecI/CopY family transcriptional regulator [Planctomycetota bacterium]